MSERRFANPISIKAERCDPAVKRGRLLELTSGDLAGVPGEIQGTEEVARQPERQSEVSRGHSAKMVCESKPDRRPER